MANSVFALHGSAGWGMGKFCLSALQSEPSAAFAS